MQEIETNVYVDISIRDKVRDSMHSNGVYLTARIASVAILYITGILRLFFFENKESFDLNVVYQNYLLFFVPLAIEYSCGFNAFGKVAKGLRKISIGFCWIMICISLAGIFQGIPKVISDKDTYKSFLEFIPIFQICMVILDKFFSVNKESRQFITAMNLFENIYEEYDDIIKLTKENLKNEIKGRINKELNKSGKGGKKK